MSEGTLYDKVWDRHTVTKLPTGQDQLFVGLHLVHEVTSPQAFGMLKERDQEVAFPERTHATVDHIVPTGNRDRPYDDAAENMMGSWRRTSAARASTFPIRTPATRGSSTLSGRSRGSPSRE